MHISHDSHRLIASTAMRPLISVVRPRVRRKVNESIAAAPIAFNGLAALKLCYATHFICEVSVWDRSVTGREEAGG